MSSLHRVRAVVASTVVALLVMAPHVDAAPPVIDPLPAWNDGPAKRAILQFVSRSINPGSGYLAPSERVAVFGEKAINHDDPAREFAYEEKDSASVGAATLNGWTIVSMKSDWRTVFADPSAKPSH